MKKSVVFLIILILLLPSVFAAGVIYDVSVSYDGRLFSASERDMLRLNIDNKEHYIKIDKVYSIDEKVDLAIFIAGVESPNYVTINKERYAQVDFERDNVPDLKIGLKEVKDKNITLILIKPKEIVTGNVTKTISGGTKFMGILITILIVILGLIIYLLLIRKKS